MQLSAGLKLNWLYPTPNVWLNMTNKTWHMVCFEFPLLSLKPVSVWFFLISCFNQCTWVIVSAFCIPTRTTQHHDTTDCTAYQAASPQTDPLIIIMMIVNFYSALNTHGKSMLLVDTGVYLLIQDAQTLKKKKKWRNRSNQGHKTTAHRRQSQPP